MDEKIHRLGVYVAGNPKTHRDQIRAFMDWVICSARYIYLTHDWLEDYEYTQQPVQDVREECWDRACAAWDDLEGVKRANVVVAFDSEVNQGLTTEIGAALALDKRVIVIDPQRLQIFYYHPNVILVEDVGQATARLIDLHTALKFAV